MNVIIKAYWPHPKEETKSNIIRYDFNVHIRDKSVFTVNKTDVPIGDFIILECTNISDANEIYYQTDTESKIIKNLIKAPTFYRYNDRVLGIISIPRLKDLEGQKFTINIGYLHATDLIEINILPTEEVKESTDKPTETLNTTEIKKLLTKNDSFEEIVYFQGKRTRFSRV